MKRFLVFHILFGLNISLSIFIFSASCLAQSSADGYTQMKGGNYSAALKIFSTLTEQHPKVADYWRSIGWCSYKLKKYAKAVDALSKSLEMESYAKVDNKVRGKAYYNLGEYAKAITDLERYMPSFPHDAATRLILAVAYKKEGKFDEAEKELKKVAKDSPTLKQYAKLQIATIASKRGKSSASANLFNEMKESLIEGYPMDELIREKINLTAEKVKFAAAKGDKRKWNASVALGLDYSDNVMFLSSDTVTPADTSSGGDASVFMTATGKYQILKSGPHSIDGTANLYANKHISEDDADVIKITPKISYGFTGWQRWNLRSTLGIDEMMVDNSVRSIYFSQQGMLSWNLTMSTLLNYTYANNDFKDATSARENRDGSYHTFKAIQYYKLGSGRRVNLGATLKSNKTKGDEFESTTFGFNGGYRHPFKWNTQMDYNANVGFTNYANPSLFSTPPLSEKRSDTTYGLSISWSKELSARLSANLSIGYSAKSSNIASYEYSKFSISPSLTYLF
ncbi:MAG: tetratricopeptide repeat protein [Proteobacteria bacterium]|nr:tetratricopeptide repeat protein [Pseudomonadota bacterium]MBU1717171.1 tetratricopeptide repeat protein [Pseudomonadota bacterium]